MYFDSFSEFIAMGEHGFYVWLAYGVTLTALLGLVGWLKLKRSSIMKDTQQRIVRLQTTQASEER